MSASIVQRKAAFAQVTDTSPSFQGQVSVTLDNPISAGNIVVFASAVVQTNGSNGLAPSISIADNLGNGYTGGSYAASDGSNGHFCNTFQGAGIPQAGARTYTLTFDPASGETGYGFLIGLCVYEVTGAGSGFNYTNESASQALSGVQNINNLTATISGLTGGTYGNLLVAIGAFTDISSLSNMQAVAAGSGWSLDGRNSANLAFSPAAIVFESQLVTPGSNPAAKFSGNTSNTENDGVILVAAYSLTAAISGGGSGGSSTTFLGSVVEVSSDPDDNGVFLGTVSVVSQAPNGVSNPFLGKVRVVTAPAGRSNPSLGQVVVVSNAPNDNDPFLGQVATS